MNTVRIKHVLLVCLAVVFPWHSQIQLLVGQFNLSLGDPLVVLIGILLLSGVLSMRMLPSFSTIIFSFIIFAISSLFINAIRFPATTDIVGGVVGIVKLVASIAYFIAVIILIDREAVSRIYLFALSTTIVVTVFAGWTSIETLSGSFRPSGPFDNPNLYADYLLFSFFMVLLVLDQNWNELHNYKLMLLGFPIPLIVISLLGTESRSGIGAFIVGLAILILLNYDKYINKINSIRSFAPLVIGLIGGILILFSRDWSVITRFQSLSQGRATGGRFDRWIQSIDVLYESTFLGVGWGQHPQYIVSGHELHNTVVQVTVESGILGGILLVAIWLFVIRRGIQLALTKKYSHAIYLTAFLTATIANSVFHNNLNFRTLWLAIGLIGTMEICYWRDTRE